MEILMGKRRRVDSYGMWEKESRKDEEHPLEPYHCTEKLEVKGLVPKNRETGEDVMEPSRHVAVEGRLIGGCMDCLVNLLGTKFDQVGTFLESYRKDGDRKSVV